MSAAEGPPPLDAAALRAAAQGAPDALARLSAALKRGAAPACLSALSPAETTRLLLRLRPRRARALLRALDEAPSLAVLHELDRASVALLLDAESAARVARIVAKLDADIAADFLAGAPPALVEAALAQSPQADAIRAALRHRAGSAGAMMRRRLVAAPQDWTLGRLIDEIRAQSERIDRLYAVYVIDAERRLVGYLKVRDLLLHPADTRVGAILRPDVTAVTAATDREEVARVARREHLPALPVVDGEGRLLGMVTVDELRAIDRAEAEEDQKLMAGLDPEAEAADGPLAILRRRLPWLAGGLVGAGAAALVVGAYEDALTEAAILASLIPIVMSLAGNAGIQAATVTVQAMTAGRLWLGDLAGRTLRELAGAMLNGGAVGLITAAGIMVLSQAVEIERAPMLALTAALTLVVVTVQASAVGSLIPVLLDRLRFDPAVATGVFITTANDVVGVLVFFLIATTFYI